MCDVALFFFADFVGEVSFIQTVLCFFNCLTDQVFEAHNSACAGFEWLSICAVHSAETCEDEFRFVFVDQLTLLSGAEDLFEVQMLALVDDIDDFFWCVCLDAVNDGR